MYIYFKFNKCLKKFKKIKLTKFKDDIFKLNFN